MDQNDRWVAKNFMKLMDLYGGRYVAVVNRRVVAVGETPDQVEDFARTKTGVEIPSVVHLPKKEELRIA
jgi:hypothetical protein